MKKRGDKVPAIPLKQELPTPHLVDPNGLDKQNFLQKSETQYTPLPQTNFQNTFQSGFVPVSPIQSQQGLSTFSPTTRELNLQPSQTQQEDQPFFVRIDKFNLSKGYLNSIIKKVDDVKDIIDNLEKIKEKENQEVSEWKQQNNSIKELLTQIDREMFGKL